MTSSLFQVINPATVDKNVEAEREKEEDRVADRVKAAEDRNMLLDEEKKRLERLQEVFRQLYSLNDMFHTAKC